MNCPKCGHPKQPESNECQKCGIIFAKYQELMGKKQEAILQKEETVKSTKKIREKTRTQATAERFKFFLKKLSIKKIISQFTSFQKTALIVIVILFVIGIGYEVLKPDVTIDGEVFIVTKGGQNIKLGIVEVALFPMDTMLPFLQELNVTLQEKLSELEPKLTVAEEYMDHSAEEKSYYNELLIERELLMSCSFFFHNHKMPASFRATRTNSDGKFHLLVPSSGLYVITATATRQVFDDVERYYWMIQIDPKSGTKQTIMLSNNNLVLSTDEIVEFINTNSNK